MRHRFLFALAAAAHHPPPSTQMLVVVLELRRSALSHRALGLLVGKLQHRYRRLPLRHQPQLTLCSSVHRVSPPKPIAMSRASLSHAVYPTRAPVRASPLPLRRCLPLSLAASRCQRHREWEKIKIPCTNLTYISKSTRCLSLLTRLRPASYR
jgi:hypothetical protein